MAWPRMPSTGPFWALDSASVPSAAIEQRPVSQCEGTSFSAVRRQVRCS